jgi:hypothetical protein
MLRLALRTRVTVNLSQPQDFSTTNLQKKAAPLRAEIFGASPAPRRRGPMCGGLRKRAGPAGGGGHPTRGGDCLIGQGIMVKAEPDREALSRQALVGLTTEIRTLDRDGLPPKADNPAVQPSHDDQNPLVVEPDHSPPTPHRREGSKLVRPAAPLAPCARWSCHFLWHFVLPCRAKP